MNVIGENEPLTIDEYTVTFHDPQYYTLIQAKRDPFSWLALLGGLVTMGGIILAFYFQLTRVWAVDDEENGTWRVSGSCPKGGVLFRERFTEVMDSGK
jgi:cytochrome c biogenesis protein ResB